MMREAKTGPFYHGTRSSFKVGDVVMPRNALADCPPARRANDRPAVMSYPGDEKYAYATDSLLVARLAARIARGTGPPLVYQVLPIGEFTAQPLPHGHEFLAAGWRVTRLVPDTGGPLGCAWMAPSRPTQRRTR